MGFIGLYIIASTFALGVVASMWKGVGWANIAIKMLFVGLTVAGAIASATTLGLHS